MNDPLNITIGCVLACFMIMVPVLHSRERDYDEFSACVKKGGSTLNRRYGVTCRMPNEKAIGSDK